LKKGVHCWNIGEQEEQHGAAAEQAVESEGVFSVESFGVLRRAVCEKAELQVPDHEAGNEGDGKNQFHLVTDQKNAQKETGC
jgi:hypothetical protein